MVAYAEWRGLTPLVPASEIVVRAEPALAPVPTAAERPEDTADSDAALRQEIAAGVARFRAEFTEHRSKQAAPAETPAPVSPPAVGEASPAKPAPDAAPRADGAFLAITAERLAQFEARMARERSQGPSQRLEPLLRAEPYRPVTDDEVARW